MRRALVRIGNGSSVRDACKSEGLSRHSFMRAVEKDPKWREDYAFSLAQRAHALADDIIAIADGERSAKKVAKEIANAVRDLEPAKAEAVARAILNSSVQRDRLATDARKWVASKLLPSHYGATQALSSAQNGPQIIRVVLESLPDHAAANANLRALPSPTPEADYDILD